jgi:CRISPR/Cas system endoribonuclease Cas6 (RAMP superfamily)
MTFGGLLGSVKFRGDLAHFNTLLKAGEYIHIGKSTSFGFELVSTIAKVGIPNF